MVRIVLPTQDGQLCRHQDAVHLLRELKMHSLSHELYDLKWVVIFLSCENKSVVICTGVM